MRASECLNFELVTHLALFRLKCFLARKPSVKSRPPPEAPHWVVLNQVVWGEVRLWAPTDFLLNSRWSLRSIHGRPCVGPLLGSQPPDGNPPSLCVDCLGVQLGISLGSKDDPCLFVGTENLFTAQNRLRWFISTHLDYSHPSTQYIWAWALEF